jgi:uncharacterized protein (DUF1697 family)
MAGLREMVAGLGFADVRSILQSGNLIFRSDVRGNASLERMLEAEAETRLELQADFIVRSAKEWKEVVARNPFRKEAERDPGHLVAMFLKSAPDSRDVKAIQAAITGPEIVRADGMQVYIVYPEGIGRSRLTNAVIEKKLGRRGTARNWNTVVKLDAIADE